MSGYITLVLLGLGLSMDTLAVSVTIGICKSGIRPAQAARVASFFAFFQTLMPAAGYLAGIKIISLIKPFDHWVAFGLLAFIGGKMIIESLQKDTDVHEETKPSCPREDPISARRLTFLALATSIDAMAAGVSLAVDEAPIIAALIIIGAITFLAAAAGTLLGKRLGAVFQRGACRAGGGVLILIGLKIVVEHIVVA